MATRSHPPNGRSTLALACLSGADLGPKLVSAERALSAIRAGSRVYIGTGCAAPRTLLAQLEAMNPGPADLEFIASVTTGTRLDSGHLAISLPVYSLNTKKHE